jgi:hypothetical protein
MTFKRLSKISLTSSPQRPVLLTALTTLVLTLFLTTAAPAMLIVDTGVLTAAPGGTLFGWQWFYGQFTTSQDFIVTDVFGYINGGTYDGYQVTLTLSSDSSGGLEALSFSRILSLPTVRAGRAFPG